MFFHILISLALAAPPQTFLVKAPDANPHEFFVFAQNSGDSKVSQALTSCDQTSKINQLLKEGQFQFLNGSLDSAQKKFSQISEMKWNCDWKEDERKIVVFSLFRLAQLSQNPSEQMNLVTEAINFDDEIKPDVSVFPPPLMDLYRKTKTQMTRQQLLLPEFAKKYSGLYRNGKFISLNTLAINSYPMRARLTLSSDTYRPETVVVTPEEFQKYDMDPKALVDGNCNTFSVAEELQSLSYKVFFGPDCIKSNKETVATVSPVAQGFTENLSNTTPFGPRKKTWFERNLLWIGITVVSSIAVSQMIKHNDDNDETVVRPSNTLSEGN